MPRVALPAAMTDAHGGARGLRALAPALRRVQWPPKFKPEMPPHYDGTTDHTEFLQLYELSIEAANGDE